MKKSYVICHSSLPFKKYLKIIEPWCYILEPAPFLISSCFTIHFILNFVKNKLSARSNCPIFLQIPIMLISFPILNESGCIIFWIVFKVGPIENTWPRLIWPPYFKLKTLFYLHCLFACVSRYHLETTLSSLFFISTNYQLCCLFNLILLLLILCYFLYFCFSISSICMIPIT